MNTNLASLALMITYKALVATLFFLFVQNNAFALIRSHNSNEVYAVLIPLHEATLSSELNGKITKILYKPGMKFKKGASLLIFDCRPIELELQQVNASLKGTSATLQSNRQLARHKSVSIVDVKRSESEHEKLLAEQSILKYQKQKCILKAPYDGEIITTEVNASETVKANDPLLTIVNNKSFEVQMFVPSVWLNQIKIGYPFKLYLDEIKTSKPFRGKINRIVGKVDTASQSVMIYGQINAKDIKEHQLYAGVSGHAYFTLEER